MFTGWCDEMATGNEEIDAQHKDLLKKVADLLTACKAGRGSEEIARLLWFLKRYVRKHFSDEEKLQLILGFPGYRAHKAQHDAFYQEVKRLEARHAKEGASTVLIVQSVHLMCDWLHKHFNQMDLVLVEFVRDVAGRDKP